MTAVSFDTLKFVHRLRDAGFPEAQAEAIAVAFKDAQSEVDTPTKGDLRIAIADLRADLIKWMIGLALAQMGLLVGILLKLGSH
jgi:hypothetical protein